LIGNRGTLFEYTLKISPTAKPEFSGEAKSWHALSLDGDMKSPKPVETPRTTSRTTF